MAALEAMMKKHNISIDSSSSSHGHALFASVFSFNTPSTTSSSFDEWLIDSRASYHMAKDKAIFSTLNECNTKEIFVGDDISLSVVGSGTIQVENGHFNDVLCVPYISCNLLSVYQVTHSGEGKTIEFSPHQVVIKNLKDPKHVLATVIVDDITRLYKFDKDEAWTKIKLDVSHFRVFGSKAWAHIPDEKRKALQPKSEKCIFFGYSEDVKGYRLLQPHCNEIILRRDVKFDENLLACEPNSTVVSSSACEPSSAVMPSSVPILDSSSDDESEDENPPLPADIPLDESFEPEQAPVPRFLDGSVHHEK
jgi:hypothetical protein